MNKTALLGYPNIGKTTLFNSLTNSYEYVGNWSGVTVEKKVGNLHNNSGKLIDLPGMYDLAPLSKDEEVVMNFFLNEKFNSVLNIIDANHLSTNLHLTIQALEFGKPVIVGLNMVDVAKRNGYTINDSLLSKRLGVTSVPTIARTGEGCSELLNEIACAGESQAFELDYGVEIESLISQITKIIGVKSGHNKRWLSIQFLLNNKMVISYLEGLGIKDELKAALENKSFNEVIVKKREEYINSLIEEVVTFSEEGKVEWPAKVDALVTHRIFGLPIFLFIMYLVFQATFTWIGAPLSDIVDGFIGGTFTELTEKLLSAIGASTLLHDLVVNGIIAGVGGVLVFVPQIFILFLFISFLEDSGYMSRIAVVMDRFMDVFGLNGKSFIPMIISFGCNVPGIMAARSIEQKKDRLITILTAPFMSCSARLPVYVLFAGAFFSSSQGTIVFSLYVLGIILALIVTKILSLTILKDEKSIFIVELPQYNLPHAKTLFRSTWEKGKNFIHKAGTIIFAGSIGIWLISYFGMSGANVEMNDSFLAAIGGFFAPIFSPLGFGTWQATAALITGFLAKEVVVSSMAIIYAVSDDSLGVEMLKIFTPASAYAFMVFILLYIPCLATVAVIYRETKSKMWTIISMAYPLVVAYVIAFIINKVGQFFF
jgi:ferrous iron transport protein B